LQNVAAHCMTIQEPSENVASDANVNSINQLQSELDELTAKLRWRTMSCAISLRVILREYGRRWDRAQPLCSLQRSMGSRCTKQYSNAPCCSCTHAIRGGLSTESTPMRDEAVELAARRPLVLCQ
jgi:hypothetical protein